MNIGKLQKQTSGYERNNRNYPKEIIKKQPNTHTIKIKYNKIKMLERQKRKLRIFQKKIIIIIRIIFFSNSYNMIENNNQKYSGSELMRKMEI